MQTLGYYLGVSKQTEVLLLTLIGISCSIFDASLLDLNSNLHKVWETVLDPKYVSGKSQLYIKYLLSGIILVRSFTLHLYLAFYIVMLWPAIFEERPGLLLPWLIVGAIKCLGMGFMSFCTGMFTCFAYGVYRPACLDFMIAQIIDHTPSFYMWYCVLSYYRELKTCATVITYEKSKSDLESEIMLRRRKVRSMADSIILKRHCPIDEERHLISVSTIENIVQQLTTDLHRKTTRSLDSLLGVMAAEAEKEELMNLCDELPSDETGLTIQERTAKLLKLTKQDIIDAQNRKKLGKGLVFTYSMLNVQTVLDKVHTAKQDENLPKTAYTTFSLPAENLRVTKSEKGHMTQSDFSKYRNATDFMSNISETEIGSVLNYSSISLENKNEVGVVPRQPSSESSQISETEKVELLQKVDNLDVKELPELENLEKLDKPKTNNNNVENAEKFEITEEQDVIFSKTFDVGCQASTLSRSILKSPLQQQKCNDRSNKTSIRTSLTKHSLADGARSKKDGKQIGSSKVVARKLYSESMSGEVEIPKNTSSFKADGYTMAYNDKLRTKKDTDKF